MLESKASRKDTFAPLSRMAVDGWLEPALKTVMYDVVELTTCDFPSLKTWADAAVLRIDRQ
jgi:hypothetical protein